MDSLLAELRRSPQLPDVVAALQEQLEEEKQRRARFYEEMTPEEKVEFIGGEVILHSPARNRHLDVTMNIATLLRIFVTGHRLGTVKVEKCLVVFPRNDYEPDIVYFGPEKSATLEPDTMKFPIPDLAVEVLSESTEVRDRGVKFEDYAAHGVAEYWIVDPEASVLEQYVLEGGEYVLRLKAGNGRLASVAIAGFSTELAAFFDAEANLAAVQTLTASSRP